LAIDPEEWLQEHAWVLDGRASFVPTREALLRGLFLAWGVALLFVFGCELVIGVWISPAVRGLPGWWVVSLALGAFGSWLAFELAHEVGFEVSKERAAPSDFPAG
jgi:hypothetical protein